MLSSKIIICLFPILPKLSLSLNKFLFQSSEINEWPSIKLELLVEDKINLPIQINGKLITIIPTRKGYEEEEILHTIYQLDKIKSKIKEKNVIRVINVQDKIINIIIS